MIFEKGERIRFICFKDTEYGKTVGLVVGYIVDRHQVFTDESFAGQEVEYTVKEIGRPTKYCVPPHMIRRIDE